MPIVRIDYDNKLVKQDEVEKLARAVKAVVADSTGIPEVYVYADCHDVTIDIAPIEIFVEMSREKILDLDELFTATRNKLSKWKQKNNFEHPISLTIIPMNWKFEVGI
ncbi:MAG: hypothetical protein Q8Q20_04675 [bacterium]|nr:hypothetical protein [bacterium]